LKHRGTEEAGVWLFNFGNYPILAILAILRASVVRFAFAGLPKSSRP